MTRRRLEKMSHAMLIAALLGALSVLLTCSWIVHHERRKLDALITSGGAPPVATIYSRWLEISPALSSDQSRILAWLQKIGYRDAGHQVMAAGDYASSGNNLTIYTKDFAYPDRQDSAQIIQLFFSNGRLSDLRDSTGRRLDSWRLEPYRFAQWGPEENTSHNHIHLSDLPAYVPEAVVAVEDKRFYGHGALDVVGLLRAFWVDLRHAGLRQGASTISQQLARSIFLTVDRTWRRKILEAGLAFYLEAHYSKPQLLEMYLNQVYWGQNGSESLLGIEAIGRSLLGKPAAQLTLSDSAMLAGMLESPNRLSPRNALAPAMGRRDHVLTLMREQGMISESEFKKAKREKIILAPAAGGPNNAAYFLAMLHDDLSDRYGLPALVSSGWDIFTTLDPLWQDLATKAVASLSTPKEDGPQGALVALDSRGGAIRAWVGGTDFVSSPFDRAGHALRQPGSTFKPFVALAAIESRKATTAMFLDDSPLTVMSGGVSWTPRDVDRHFHGKVSLWDAVVHSLNVPMVRLAMQIGLPVVIDAAERAGISGPLPNVPAVALGAAEVTVVELTAAYATLASGGERSSPYFIDRIVAPDRTLIESHTPQITQAFAPEPVFIVTQMLQAVLDEGTGRGARAMGLTAPVAGKTGTSEKNQDAWFVGYSSTIVCGVWVGYDRPRSLGSTGAGIALPIWTRFMKNVLTSEPTDAPVPPAGLVSKKIDPASGDLAQSGCPVRVDRLFLPGTEPTQSCPLHRGGLIGFFKRLTGNVPKPTPVSYGH